MKKQSRRYHHLSTVYDGIDKNIEDTEYVCLVYSDGEPNLWALDTPHSLHTLMDLLRCIPGGHSIIGVFQQTEIPICALKEIASSSYNSSTDIYELPPFLFDLAEKHKLL